MSFDSPNMSVRGLLVTVEDLISMAMGPSDKNTVNFKLIQTILHILARQMRLLEQRVEIHVGEEREREKDLPAKLDDIREERKSKDSAQKTKEEAAREQIEKVEKAAMRERERAERAASKDREKAERAAAREKDRGISKEQDKAERAASKERDRAERAEAKEKEKAERAASKERDKAEKEAARAEKAAAKEREKADKAAAKADRAASKEREKADESAEKTDKASMKEKEKAEKAAMKEKETDKQKEGKGTPRKEKEEKLSPIERAEMEATKEEKGHRKSKAVKGKAASDTSIVISVEKGPTTRSDRRENIEVVTQSQFDILKEIVKDLKERAGPMPPPALPDNKQLMSDLAKGSASLTDTMQAMQVTARIRAAENAISRMGDMLTALATAGALPKEFIMVGVMTDSSPQTEGKIKFDADTGEDLTRRARTASAPGRKSVAIDLQSMPEMKDEASTAYGKGRPSTASGLSHSSSGAMGRSPSAALGRSSMPSALGRPSRASSMHSASVAPGVTHPEMDDAVRGLRDDLINTIQNTTKKATYVAESASASVKAVSDQLAIALTLDERVSTLHALVADYAEQLSGFDSGLNTQMASFRDQMNEIQSQLNAGLKQLEQVNNNAETAAVMGLTERYEGLASELDHTLHTHRELTNFQAQLGNELHSLVDCIEMLREQKADRDEVMDGLRDKADNSRLAGLLTVVEFRMAKLELEKRLEVCHDKFRRQEAVWMTALKDLAQLAERKAELTQLMAVRDAAEAMLMELQEKQERLALILGEPKAAMIMRALTRDAVCGSCLAPALMQPQDKSYGAPPALPGLRPRPVGADEEPCVPEWKPPQPPDNRDHRCHRWCGGSHTLLAAVARERAPPVQLHGAPTMRYVGYGVDGRLYMLEDECRPCVECNELSDKIPGEPAPAPPANGAGDQEPPTEPR